ncbi:uncharacterized protein Z519_03537 [Cladophialophora bantiana CBS 173.52]|uniref:RNA helicase n=1 Tax=Cladophialophora bantiana (strain ATCC 10958 / CBS 173.52 / CDC B-1940 / NIH 8579) TaxID=1442370 RepID=A0A0D2HSM8_CLAB1|nr:uncharacterized protein Z519_03537 [Cladophialophora bantiana CBS 173.52]KIW96468.1 hypothetical protein Z519_03537 [Cladophialophora bantiana CBS 173.52]
MASSFYTADVASVLADITPSNGVEPTAGPPKNEEAIKLARQSGWVEPKANNYTSRAPTALLNGHDGEPEAAAEDEASVEEAAVSRYATSSWSHDAAKYEWKEEYGDVGPRDEKLEKDLFRGEHINRAGIKFENLTTVEVTVESETRVNPVSSFKDAGLHPVILENIELCGYRATTPIQAYTIPAVLTGHDMIGIAQTGSGKTAAFLIPTISKLMGKVKKLAAPRPNIGQGFDPFRDRVRAEPLILIVAPTRELCCQIFDEARRLCYRSMLRPCVAYGGAPIRDQAAQLQRGCDLLVASPGRLLDFMSRPELLSLARVRYTIIDEADEMLHDDWGGEMSKIMGGGVDANTDGDHRYLLFSATFPKRVRKLAAKYLASDYVHVSVGRTGSVHVNVKQHIMWCDGDKKMKALYDLLISMPPSRTLIFVKFKKTADFVDDYLFNLGLPSTSIHSDRTQSEREDALRSFKGGQTPILVATGVTARGLDVRNVMHVINFDLPSADHDGKNEYVHRIGRTARIGNEGLATSFYNEKDEALGPFLTKILLETNQDVPEFLAHFKPEGGDLNFDEEEGPEFEGDAAGDKCGNGGNTACAGDVWGAGGDTNAASSAWGASGGAAAPTNDNWGSNNAEVGGGGW